MKSDGFGIFLAGLLRLIFHRNLKIALVLGVVCIGVKGFFFGLLFLLLLCESVEAAACRQRNQHDHTQKAGCDTCDLVFLGLFLAGCCRFFGGFFRFFLGFQPVLFRLRRCFFFSGVGIGSIFLHQSQKVGFVHKVHKVNGLLPLGVAVNHQIESRTRLRHQRNELLTAAIGIVGVVIVHQRQIALRGQGTRGFVRDGDNILYRLRQNRLFHRGGIVTIALPEEYTKFDPNQVLREFTEQFKKRYDVECVSALHHNKTKKNYHIHLIFSERRLLPEPEVKIATRSVFYDELGKRVRTKKEITGEDGQIREGCIVIKKGEAYEKHLFTAKDEVFKNELFLDEAKQFYTALINRHIHDPERRLKVFDPNSVYLPTKKIGKNNPKEAEIEADNAARQDWNRTADMALVSGIEESKIIEIRNEHVYDEATRSVQKHGWLPGLFRGIIQKTKEILQVLIRETEIPPKPTLSVDMAEYRTMQKLMVKVQDEARAIKQLMHGELPKLEKQLAETTGLFRGKERKALQEKISGVQQEIDRRMDLLPGILKEDGYPDVQAFKRTYDDATALVEQYNRDLAAWERQVHGGQQPQQKPPEKESIRKKLPGYGGGGQTPE